MSRKPNLLLNRNRCKFEKKNFSSIFADKSSVEGEPTYLPTNQLTYLPTYLLTYLPTYLPTYLHTNLLTYIHTYPHTYLLTYLPNFLPTYLLTYLLSYLPLPPYADPKPSNQCVIVLVLARRLLIIES